MQSKQINSKKGGTHMTSTGKRAAAKMRSDIGASITFGLLLFLICAVISSVVLVAGTSAAGRMSGMSETEQKYYSVSSTEKLVQELLESGTATVIKIDGEDYLVSGTSLKPLSGSSVVMPGTLPDYIAYKLSGFDGSGGNFKLKLDMSSLDSKAAEVDISAEVDESDHISLTIASEDYSVPVNFSTSKKSMPVNVDIDGTSGSGTKTVYTWDLAGPENE